MSASISNKLIMDNLGYYVNAIDPKCYNGGTGFTDLSINKYTTGTLINGVSHNNGTFNFDGVNDYIDTGLDLSYTTSDKFTICAYFNTRSNSLFNQGIFGKPNNSFGTGIDCNGYEWRFFLRNNQLRFTYWSNGGNAILNTTSSEIIVPNKWYYCVLVYENNQAKLYLNGNLVGTDASVFGTFMNRTNNVMIGFTYGDNCTSGYFWGKIPSVQIYNRVLTETEIKQNYRYFQGAYR